MSVYRYTRIVVCMCGLMINNQKLWDLNPLDNIANTGFSYIMGGLFEFTERKRKISSVCQLSKVIYTVFSLITDTQAHRQSFVWEKILSFVFHRRIRVIDDRIFIFGWIIPLNEHSLTSQNKKVRERELLRKHILVIVSEINQHEKGNVALDCVECLLIRSSLEHITWPKWEIVQPPAL